MFRDSETLFVYRAMLEVGSEIIIMKWGISINV